jgi:hypothetical protein
MSTDGQSHSGHDQADHNHAGPSHASSPGLSESLAQWMRPVTAAIATAYLGLFRDGWLGRAGTQGLDELGQALKAFPDSIHADTCPAVPFPNEAKNQDHDTVWGRSAHEDGHGDNMEQNRKGWAERETERRQSNSDSNDQNGRRGGNLEQNRKGWAERETERRQGNNDGTDQNDQARGRVLPDEQRKEREQDDRGRSR